MATSLYQKPRTGVNWVGWGMLLALLTAGFFTWKFLPVYQTAWEVDKLLNDALAKAYHLNRQREPERSQKLRTLLLDLRGKLPEAGVTDPGVSVSIDDTGTLLRLRCTWSVTVDLALGKSRTMAMDRVVETESKPKKWD